MGEARVEKRGSTPSSRKCRRVISRALPPFTAHVVPTTYSTVITVEPAFMYYTFTSNNNEKTQVLTQMYILHTYSVAIFYNGIIKIGQNTLLKKKENPNGIC